MSWTYLEYNIRGDLIAGEAPPPKSVCLVFESLRWALCVGYVEPGGYASVLEPHVTDDCCWLAWAPFGSGPPDIDKIADMLPTGGGGEWEPETRSAMGYHGSDIDLLLEGVTGERGA